MRTPKYGVTKHHVLGLEVVTATGEIIRTGGKTVKNVVGFDLTGLMCGREGMLGIITEATLKLLPMPEATSTVRANFHSMEAACKVLTKFTPEGLLPMAMEVIDKFCVAAVEENFAFGLSKEAEAILLVAVDGSKEEVAEKRRNDRADHRRERRLRHPACEVERRGRQALGRPPCDLAQA